MTCSCFIFRVMSWSCGHCFGFLMPGFLGSEELFQSRFGKPILQSREAKSSFKEQEAGECPWIEH